MNIGQIYRVLMGRRWIIIGTVIIATCMTYFIVHDTEVMSRSRATLLIDFQEPTLGTTLPPQLQEGYLATQSEIIASTRVAEYVINMKSLTDGEQIWNQLNFDESTTSRFLTWIFDNLRIVKAYLGFVEADQEGTFENEAEAYNHQVIVNELLNHLRISPRENTRLIDIVYMSRNPEFGIEMANAFADAYVAVNLEFNTAYARNNAEWMETQLIELREKMDRAQRRLTDYEMQTGILATDERVDIELRHLSELTAELATAQAQAEFEENKITQLENMQELGADLNSVPEVMSNTYLQTLKTELRRKEAELADISTEIGKNHPDYQRRLAEIESLREKLRSEITTVAEGIRNQSQLARAKVNALDKAQGIQKNKLLEGKGTSSELPALVREIENAQHSYELALQRYEDYNLQSQITQTNAAVLSYADKSIRPSMPNIAKNLTLAAFLGLILGCCAALFLEVRSPRVRSDSDLDVLQLPYLGKVNAG